MAALLSARDRERVEEAIRTAEARTSAEIVLSIVPRSGEYAARVGAAALLTTLITAWLLHLAWPTLATGWLLLFQVPLFVGFFALARLPVFARLLIPDPEEIAAVHREALRVFAEHGLHETRQRNGVLILVSVYEHRVEILADRGIAEKIEPDHWKAHVAHILKAIAQGRAADGLCETVQRIAEQIAKLFPPEPDGSNQLPELV
jgi:putative membrane protein